MIHRLAVAALALGLPAGTALAGPADTQAALNACASGYPDKGRIAAGLSSSGFTDMGEISDGRQGLHMFVSADGKTYAGTEGATASAVRCVIVEDRLSTRKAEALAGALVRLMPGATELQAPRTGGIEATKYFAGMLRDTMTGVMVVKSYAFKDAKGAALLVVKQ